MRRFILPGPLLLWMLALLQSSVAQSQGDGTWLIPYHVRFRMDSEIITKEERDYSSGMKRLVQSEQGVYNNVRYRFWFSDASGFFEEATGEASKLFHGPVGDLLKNYKNSWSVGYKKDSIDNKKFCYVRMRESFI